MDCQRIEPQKAHSERLDLPDRPAETGIVFEDSGVEIGERPGQTFGGGDGLEFISDPAQSMLLATAFDDFVGDGPDQRQECG